MENVFTLQKRATLAKTLRDADTIGIIASQRQNFDTMGAALGLMLALQASKKNVTVVSPKDPLVEISNLFGIDKVKKSFDSSIKQLTISFPFTEGEIEKAMYKTEGNKINVHFYAAKDKTISFKEDNVEFIKKGGTPEVVFALAVSDEEIADYIQDKDSVKIIRISRHPKDTSGDIVYQDTSFSSVAEIATKIIQEQGLPLDNDAAQNLLDGIIFSTRNYTHAKTSPFAFDATGFLLKKGAQRREVEDIKEEAEETAETVETESAQDEQKTQDTKNENGVMLEQEKDEEQPQDIQKEDDQVTQQTESSKNGEKKTSEEKTEEQNDDEVPSDWFEPKVFKSSKNS